MTGIYKITNTVNGKCYIGQSTDLPNRIRKHIKTLLNGTNRNEHLQNAYKKYGPGSFTIEIIEECSEEQLDAREIFWIDFYKSYDRNFGYNKTPGGKGGNGYFEILAQKEKESLRQKMSESKTGMLNPIYGTYCYTDGVVIKYIKDTERAEYESNGWYRGVPDFVKVKESIANSGTNNSFYGKHHSDDTKRKISENRLGENNWNFGKLLYHKEDQQKYILPEEISYYESIGWLKGATETSKRKSSESKRGKKMPEATLRQKSNIYLYNGQEYIGWRKLQACLRESGYDKISQIAIEKLSNGKSVRGYDDLIGAITRINGKDDSK